MLVKGILGGGFSLKVKDETDQLILDDLKNNRITCGAVLLKGDVFIHLVGMVFQEYGKLTGFLFEKYENNLLIAYFIHAPKEKVKERDLFKATFIAIENNEGEGNYG